MRIASRLHRGIASIVVGVICLGEVALAAQTSPAGEELEFVLRAGPESRVVAGIRVELGARAATSGPDGIAHFEGVSAGEHRVAIAAFGYERWERVLEVAAGARERIEVPLVPERLVRGMGRVVVRELGEPIAGASVTLQPIEVRAARSSRLELATDREGRFALLDVPAGRYRAEVRAPGCLGAEREVELGRAGAALVFELAPEIARAALAVEVVDDAGAPIAGAELVLSEALDCGEIRRGTTSAEGRCSFADLAVALRNVAARDGALRASRREVLLRASAAGHRPAVAAVVLTDAARARVVLARLGEVREREPNDTPERAQAIEPGQTGRFRIARRGDHDWFALRLPEAGRVALRFGGTAGCDVHLEFRDEQGQRLASRGASRGEEVTAILDLAAGRYLLRFSDWGDDEVHAVEQRFALQLTSPQLNLPAMGALRLEPGSVLRGAWGSAEAPLVVSFALTQSAVVRFATNPAFSSRRLHLRARNLAEPAAFSEAPPGAALVAEALLPPGDYELALAVLDSAAHSREAIELRCDAIACASRAAARPLALEALAVAGGVPRGEVDAYRVALPSSGILRVRLSSLRGQHLRVLGADGALLAEARCAAGGRAAATASIEGAGEVRLELRAAEEEPWGPDGALLRTEWLPCEEAELGGRDDRAPLATPLALPATVAGNLVPRGDVDLVRVDLERAGRLVMEGVAALPLDLRAFDAAGVESGVARFDPLGGAISIALPPGSHALKIRALDETAWSAAGYRLRLRLEHD